MPLYTFACRTCKAVIELLLPIKDATMHTRCDGCGQVAVRMLDVPGVIYKGKGWAKRDRKQST